MQIYVYNLEMENDIIQLQAAKTSANDNKSIKVVKECIYPNRLCKFTPNAVAAELPTLLVLTYTFAITLYYH